MGKKFTIRPVKQDQRQEDNGVHYIEVFYRRKRIGLICRHEAEDDVKFYFTDAIDFPYPFPRDMASFPTKKDAMTFIKKTHKAKVAQARNEVVRYVTSLVESGVTDAGLRDYLNGVRKEVKKLTKKKIQPTPLQIRTKAA